MFKNLSGIASLLLLAIASFSLAYSMSFIDTLMITPVLFSAMGVSYIVSASIYQTQLALPSQ
jgi:hypothetical protein